MKVYVTRPVFDEAIDRLRREFEVELNTEDRILPKQELIAHLGEKDGALTLLTDAIDLELLQSTPRLKVVANFAVGFNNVAVDSATKLGVAVTNTPGVLTETTADFAWTLLMAAARRDSSRQARSLQIRRAGRPTDARSPSFPRDPMRRTLHLRRTLR